MPYEVAAIVSEKLSIPTIGIGSGVDCDGQVLVMHDLLGLSGDFNPKHGKRYIEGEKILGEALQAYMNEVEKAIFPTDKNSFETTVETIELLRGEYLDK